MGTLESSGDSSVPARETSFLQGATAWAFLANCLRRNHWTDTWVFSTFGTLWLLLTFAISQFHIFKFVLVFLKVSPHCIGLTTQSTDHLCLQRSPFSFVEISLEGLVGFHINIDQEAVIAVWYWKRTGDCDSPFSGWSCPGCNLHVRTVGSKNSQTELAQVWSKLVGAGQETASTYSFSKNNLIQTNFKPAETSSAGVVPVREPQRTTKEQI